MHYFHASTLPLRQSRLPYCTVRTAASLFISHQVPIDVFQGITDEDAAKVVDGLAPKVADRNASIEQVKKLYKLFCECDCTLLEVSAPYFQTS